MSKSSRKCGYCGYSFPTSLTRNPLHICNFDNPLLLEDLTASQWLHPVLHGTPPSICYSKMPWNALETRTEIDRILLYSTWHFPSLCMTLRDCSPLPFLGLSLKERKGRREFQWSEQRHRAMAHLNSNTFAGQDVRAKLDLKSPKQMVQC